MIDENQLVSNLSTVTHFTKWEKPEVDSNLTKVYRSTKKVNDLCQSLLSKHGSGGGLNLAHETEGSQPSLVEEDNFLGALQLVLGLNFLVCLILERFTEVF